MFSTCKSICCKDLSYTGSCQHEFPRFVPKYLNYYLTSNYLILNCITKPDNVSEHSFSKYST